jgi:glycosyltransferase involved in cell wall biosynthesis
MSVYNTPAPMLERSIGSILEQSLAAFEFLILDDGSTGAATKTHLAEAAARDSRILLYFEPHRGLTPTLNRGLELAQGELIARQDADDWSEPDRLERQAAYLAAHPETGLLGSAACAHQQDETTLWPARMPETHTQILAALESGNPFVHGSVMFRAAAARAVGGYRQELRCSQDYDFFWRLTETAGAANLIEPLYHYRYSAQSVSASRAAEQGRAHRAARLLAQARHRGEPEDLAEALASSPNPGEERECAFRASLKQADHLMLAGDYARAGRAYWALARSRPASLLAWAKLARLGLFWLAPKARSMCFR